MNKTRTATLALICGVAFFCANAFAQSELQSTTQTQAVRFFDGEKFRQIEVFKKAQGAELPPSACSAQFFYKTRYYNLYFSQENLGILKAASQNYISSFENKKLSRKDKKSFEKYAAFKTRIEWGTTRQNILDFADGANGSFGYAFVHGSPYFAICIKNAESQNNSEKPALASSGDVILLFTKAQIAELVSALE